MRLIDADEVIEKYYTLKYTCQMYDNTQYSDAIMDGMHRIIKLIKAQPTVTDCITCNEQMSSDQKKQTNKKCVDCISCGVCYKYDPCFNKAENCEDYKR